MQVPSHRGTAEVGTSACGADPANSPLAALAPSSKSRPVVANIPGKNANGKRSKGKSKSAKIANLKTSLRLVPQQLVVTQISGAQAGVKCKASLGHSRHGGSSVGLPKASCASSRYWEGDTDLTQVHTTQWIDKGPVVSPMYAIVLQSPLRLWKNASLSDTRREGEDSTRENKTTKSVAAVKASALDNDRTSGSTSEAAGRGSWLGARHVHSLALILMLVAIATLSILALYAVRKDSALAYTRFGGTFEHDREYSTVPPEGEVPTAVRGPRRHLAKRGPLVDHDSDGLVGRFDRAFEDIFQQADDHDNTTANEKHHAAF